MANRPSERPQRPVLNQEPEWMVAGKDNIYICVWSCVVVRAGDRKEKKEEKRREEEERKEKVKKKQRDSQ